MKTTVKKILSLAVVAMLFVSFQVKADKTSDEEIQKIRTEVQNAGPNDWQTLANCADKCFQKKINVDEAVKWIDKSIEINPNPENLTIKGDYYLRTKMPEEAIKTYIKALSANNNEDNLVIQAIQFKIKRAKDLMKKGY